MLQSFFRSLLIAVSMTSVTSAQVTDLTKAADAINGSVMTIRLRAPSSKPNLTNDPQAKSQPDVTVCTGVYLGEGRIVSSFAANGATAVRLTIPGGVQSTAKIRVIDEYSRLILLHTKNCKLPGIELDESLPAHGSWIVSGSAWSTEEPVLAHGIVSGRKRTLSSGNFPPLLQCSLAVSETSSGAPLVAPSGKLVGICILAEVKTRPPFAYAVPIRHVSRLIRLDEANEDKSNLLIVENRRPVVGMRLDGNVNQIKVSRLTEGGPAEKAGIKRGDHIVAVDGVQIRSVYQAVKQVMSRQPGDRVSFSVDRNGQLTSIDVKLGGGALVPRSPLPENLVEPKVAFRSNYRNMDARVSKMEQTMSRYQSVIEFLQQRLAKEQAENDQLRRLLKKKPTLEKRKN